MYRRHFIRSTLLALAGGALSGAALAAEPPTILVVGDSLSAEYGIARGNGWVALLEKKLAAEKIAAKVINASISGDTTAGGRSRLPALLKTHQPGVVVIELGSNDALRGLSLDATRANLTAMTEAAQKAGARVLLVGMQMPPNYGPVYTRRFSQAFQDVAKSQQVPLLPFLLDGFADQPERFLADGIHPTAEAQSLVLDTVWRGLKPLLGKN